MLQGGKHTQPLQMQGKLQLDKEAAGKGERAGGSQVATSTSSWLSGSEGQALSAGRAAPSQALMPQVPAQSLLSWKCGRWWPGFDAQPPSGAPRAWDLFKLEQSSSAELRRTLAVTPEMKRERRCQITVGLFLRS